MGVTIFLLLSGFSIARGMNGAQVSWPRFFWSRWLRLAPLYLFLLVIGTGALAGATQTDPIAFLSSVLMLPIPGAYTPGAWLGVAWAVRLEFLIYLFVPALLFVFTKYSPKVIVFSFLPLFMFICFGVMSSGLQLAEILYWGLPGRLFEFGIGFYLGFRGLSGKTNLNPSLSLICAGVIFTFTAFFAHHGGGFFLLGNLNRFIVYLLAIAASVLLIFYGSSTSERVGEARSVGQILSKIGSWSYSTYLWHSIILSVLIVPFWENFRRNDFSGGHVVYLGLAIYCSVVLLISWASFTLIERPFLAFRKVYISRKINTD